MRGESGQTFHGLELGLTKGQLQVGRREPQP